MGFVIDKLTGNAYIFDFPTISGITSLYQEVNVFSQLPSANLHNGEIYIVRESSGTYLLNRKEAGLYYSNSLTWRRLGDMPSFFNTSNFKLYDGNDTTKEVRFSFSGNTSNTLRKITLRNSDGTIAYLSDVDLKLNISTFNTYTGYTVTIITGSSYNVNVNDRILEVLSNTTINLLPTSGLNKQYYIRVFTKNKRGIIIANGIDKINNENNIIIDGYSSLTLRPLSLNNWYIGD